MVLRIALALLACGIVFEDAHAYDDRFTHKWITRKAAEHLVASEPARYAELAAHADDLADGAEHEDDSLLDGDTDPTTLRVQRHFHRPTDSAGLTMSGRTFPTSFAWATEIGNENQWGWQRALDLHRRGDLAEAYFTLGHVVHLVEDLTVPAHSHLDIHGPPSGDDYEGYCTTQMIDERTSMLPVPAAGTPVPRFPDLASLWRATASASYWRNMYAGELVVEGGVGRATGELPAIFPSLAWTGTAWRIDEPAVGELDIGWFEHQPGWFYFKKARFAAALDRVAHVPGGAAAGAALEPNAPGATMAALFARDLIPIAILHAASAMRLFVEQAASQGPAPAEDDPDDAPRGPAVGGRESCAAAPGRRAAGPGLLAALAALALVTTRRRS